jgi:hypothetical protein
MSTIHTAADQLDDLLVRVADGSASAAEFVDQAASLVDQWRQQPRPIRPGDLVERRDSDLDPREVVSVGRDWLTLDLLGKESPRLPLDNYVLYAMSEGSI